jgi:trigger factor
LRQTSQVKGFRPGNAPVSLIKKMYGQSILFEEINKLVLETVEKYEKENEQSLVGHVIPSSSNLQWLESGEYQDFELTYEVGFFPDFTYTIDENTELPYYNITVEEKEIDEEIDYYHNLYNTFDEADEVDNDCVIDVKIDLLSEGKGEEKGEETSEEKGEETSEEKGEETTQAINTRILISVIPDEYKSLFLGAKVNDVLNVEIRKVFPNEPDLMGMLNMDKEKLELQPEILPFTITGISKKAPFKMNQEFFDKITANSDDHIGSEQELRDYIRKNIAADYETLSLNRLYQDSVDILKEKANVAMPEDFIVKYVRFLQKEKDEISEEQFEMFVKYFVDDSRWNYILKSLFKQNDIAVTAEMIKEEAKALIKETFSGYQYYNIDDLLNYYMSNEDYFHIVVNRVHQHALAKLLKENAKLNVTDITYEEFQALFNATAKDNNQEEEDNNNQEDNSNNQEDNKEEQS